MFEKEYIEREELLKHKKYISLDRYETECVVDVDKIIEAPAADVAPVRHGYWKQTDIPSPFGRIYECSECGSIDGDHSSILGIYCWKCGAIMDKNNK